MVEMHEPSDVQLLRDYAEGGHEAAFRELVTRHTDLVYSAALRQVNSPDLAGDIAQGVFTDLARKARQVAEQMPDGNSLAGWLHRSTRYAALNHWRDTRRRLANERQAMEQLLINSESAPDWERIRPMLDEALDGLGDEDREAVLLRYFKNQDFRAVGLALGISDDTAQKRVSRAMERLREFFSKRNVTIGASGLVVLISANAVQAAPAGLAAAISAAAVSTSTAIAATKIIAMTTLQKTLVTVTVAVLAGAGIYEARQTLQLREQNQTLQQQQAPLAEQNRQLQREREQLQRERDDATNRLAALTDELAGVKKNPSEVLKLRGEVGALRQGMAAADSQSAVSKALANPETRKALREHQKNVMGDLYSDLAKRLKLTPEQTGQFNDLIADHAMDGLDLITQALHDGKSQAEVRQIFSASDTAFQGKVQALLGDDALTQYQDYNKNLSSTKFVESFGGSLTGDPTTVADKKSRLLQAMQEATQSALAAAGLPADYQTATVLNFGNYASEEEAAQSFQLKDNILGQVAARASAFLNADELNKFQEMRTNAIKNSQNFILMERKLFAPVSP
jgi:RNA polymerase sigma factor (sigma-70 family)